eukprot:sb/3472303/
MEIYYHNTERGRDCLVHTQLAATNLRSKNKHIYIYLSYYILSKLCDCDHLATMHLHVQSLKGLGDLLAGCSWVPRGNSILHVHSFTPVLISSSSTPSAIRQRTREQVREYDRLCQRVRESQSTTTDSFTQRRSRVITPVEYKNLQIGYIAVKFSRDQFLEQHCTSLTR